MFPQIFFVEILVTIDIFSNVFLNCKISNNDLKGNKRSSSNKINRFSIIIIIIVFHVTFQSK